MSYVVYGFNPPHRQWEGILALDIWYQMLYHAIDEKYPFNYDYIDRNPMQKLKVEDDGGRKYVEYFGRRVYKDALPPTIVWNDSENGVDADENHAYIWDKGVWDALSGSALDIRENRSDCVTPRGVLRKIYGIVMNAGSTIDYNIHRPTGGWDDIPDGHVNPVPVEERDFDWFHQRDKVYSDRSKSAFTKYANLHLGLAYELMSARDYHFLVEHKNEPSAPEPESGEYLKNLL